MKKTIAVFLTLLFLTAAVSSCAGGAEKSDGTGAVSEAASTEAATESNSGFVRKKYAETDYGGYEFRFLSPKPGSHFYGITGKNENEIYYEQQTGDVLNDAVYTRNMYTEELLGIKISPVWADSTDAVGSTLKKSVTAGDDAFDALLNRLDFQLNSSAENLLYNLMKIDSISLPSSWWDKNIISNFTMFNSKLYALAGDINYYDDYAVQTMYYNKKLCADLGFEQLYDTVRAGKWTFETFAAMTNASSADLNGDSAFKIGDDQYGYVNHSHAILHMIFALGEKMSVVDGDGIININASQNLVDVVGRLYDFHHKNQAVCLSGDYIKAFTDGRVMFFAEMVGGMNAFRDMQNDFGVLPMPKRDEEQKDYTAYVSNGWTTSVAVPITSSDPERAGTVLDAMSAFSSDTVTSAVYDVLLELKLIRDTDSQEMLSYVFASKVYDWAGDLAWAQSLRDIYSGLLTASSNTFVSTLDSKKEGIQKKLDAFIESYRNTDN